MCTLVFHGVPIELKEDQRIEKEIRLIGEKGWMEIVRVNPRDEYHYLDDIGGRVVDYPGDD